MTDIQQEVLDRLEYVDLLGCSNMNLFTTHFVKLANSGKGPLLIQIATLDLIERVLHGI